MERARIDKHLKKQLGLSKREIQLLMSQSKIEVNDQAVKDVATIINKFSKISVNGNMLPYEIAHYVMLNKPVGVVCATKDDKHKTVVDLLPYDFADLLHIVGRLDLNTSGLVLLTNDSDWSERLTQPEKKVEKVYQVSLAKPLSTDYIVAFNEGMYFSYEDITTQPVKLEILDSHIAQVTLTEGRYHQIKRMFGRFRNPVVALHRSQIGNLCLDSTLLPGQSKGLSVCEVNDIFK